MDFYRKRLKKAAWGWMESHRWNQGRLLKDRISGRFEKRGARNEERAEIKDQLELLEFSIFDIEGYDEWIDAEELRNWDEYRGITWNIPDEFAGDWNN